MRITKEVQQTVEVTKDIICNKCGNSCRTSTGGDDAPWHAYDGLIEAEVHGSYFSTKIGDTSKHVFSLCETCFMELQSSFKIPSFQGDAFGWTAAHISFDEEIVSEEEYKESLAEIDRLMGTKDADEQVKLEQLAMRAHNYERGKEPLPE